MSRAPSCFQRLINLLLLTGNQSAGKSSLVEAISGISVPRDAGTCTRTPYEVQLKSSTLAWSCQISLRFIVDNEGDDCAPRQVLFGPTLVDPAQVEPMLRKAQIALLHPGALPSFFVDLDADFIQRINKGEKPPGCHRKLSFSPNLVCVAIEGPDAVDLTFFDLPVSAYFSNRSNDLSADPSARASFSTSVQATTPTTSSSFGASPPATPLVTA